VIKLEDFQALLALGVGVWIIALLTARRGCRRLVNLTSPRNRRIRRQYLHGN
jgi:hypothetical protein